MSKRISKFLAMLVLTPFLVALMLILAFLMLLLPLVALVAPDVIKFNDKDTKDD